MRNFLNNLESDKVKTLCNAAESDEKLFWKLSTGQRSTSQISAFLIENKLITDKILFVKCGPIILQCLQIVLAITIEASNLGINVMEVKSRRKLTNKDMVKILKCSQFRD